MRTLKLTIVASFGVAGAGVGMDSFAVPGHATSQFRVSATVKQPSCKVSGTMRAFHGDVAVTCDVSVPYTLALSTRNGTYSSRMMLNGVHRGVHTLSGDAARTVMWGDGSASTALVYGSGTTADYLVYGRIAPGQDAYIDSYDDVIGVTVTY